MMRKINERFVRSRKLLVISVSLTCLFTVAAGGWRSGKVQTDSEAVVQQKVAKIISEILKEGEGVVDGIKVSTRVPPSEKVIEEIKSYGDAAVPVLAIYLKSASQYERDLAVGFLGHLGGRRIIKPLQDVIRYDESPTTRILALRAITQAPWDLASSVVQEAAEADVDLRVRKEAQEIIATRSSQQ